MARSHQIRSVIRPWKTIPKCPRKWRFDWFVTVYKLLINPYPTRVIFLMSTPQTAAQLCWAAFRITATRSSDSLALEETSIGRTDTIILQSLATALRGWRSEEAPPNPCRRDHYVLVLTSRFFACVRQASSLIVVMSMALPLLGTAVTSDGRWSMIGQWWCWSAGRCSLCSAWRCWKLIQNCSAIVPRHRPQWGLSSCHKVLCNSVVRVALTLGRYFHTDTARVPSTVMIERQERYLRRLSVLIGIITTTARMNRLRSPHDRPFQVF